jgi:hypothetical protein
MFIRNNFEIMQLKNQEFKKRQNASVHAPQPNNFYQSTTTPDIDIGLGSVMIETHAHSRQYSMNGDLQNTEM